MATIEITFACACGPQSIDIDKVLSPSCLGCGNSYVVRHTAPAPRFTGCVTGPCAVTKTLPAIAVAVAEKPLVLKAPDAEGAQ